MSPKQTCLVLDTNAWRSYMLLGLRTPVASALLFALRRTGGCLGLPEVIEAEVVAQLTLLAEDLTRKYEDAATLLQQLGVLDTFERASEYDLRAIIEEAIGRLHDLVLRIPFEHRHARAALKRVQEGTPPNGPKDQQFKDSAIWEALLDAAVELLSNVVDWDDQAASSATCSTWA